MVDGPSEAPRLAVVHLRHHLRAPGLIRVGGEFDRDRLGAPGRRVSIQVFDGVLGFRPFIETDKSDATRHTCTVGDRTG